MPSRLGEILAGLDNQVSVALKNCKLLSLWPSVVDEKVGRNTEPVKIQNRVLYVSTANPVWAQELSLLKREIIKKFNQQAGEEAISDIRFKAMEG